jgi:Cu-Zn family superoxide dismutase
MRRMGRYGVVLATLTAAVMVSAVPAGAAPPGGTDRHREGTPRAVVRTGQFGTWNDDRPPTAVTYDQRLVPPGAQVAVAAVSGSRSTVVLFVGGMLPNRTYGAHVHVRSCGATGLAAGPHYQNVPDPVQPSVDPAYANPHNEVWLDFTTGANGSAAAVSRVGWAFRPGGANSVVIHEHATSTAPGEAGMAGARVGCLTVPF